MDTRGHSERTSRRGASDPRASADANIAPVRTASTGKGADSTQSAPRERYDAVDLRLMDTFPASDAVARY